MLIFEPSFVKVSQMVSELETQTFGLTLGWSHFTKGHNSIKTVNEVTVHNLCTSSDNALYLYQVLRGCVLYTEVLKGA